MTRLLNPLLAKQIVSKLTGTSQFQLADILPEMAAEGVSVVVNYPAGAVFASGGADQNSIITGHTTLVAVNPGPTNIRSYTVTTGKTFYLTNVFVYVQSADRAGLELYVSRTSGSDNPGTTGDVYNSIPIFAASGTSTRLIGNVNYAVPLKFTSGQTVYVIGKNDAGSFSASASIEGWEE